MADTGEGEITSDAFPAAGVALNTDDPWRNLSLKGAPLSLNNYTNGTWGRGRCTFDDVQVNCDVAGALYADGTPRSFAGSWTGRRGTGTSHSVRSNNRISRVAR